MSVWYQIPDTDVLLFSQKESNRAMQDETIRMKHTSPSNIFIYDSILRAKGSVVWIDISVMLVTA